MASLKLFMVLVGCRPPGRNVEQHDIFFGIGASLKDLIPDIKRFWKEASSNIHIDAWREVNSVDGFSVRVIEKNPSVALKSEKLFFVNLGGYQANKFEEQHYVLLTIAQDKATAMKKSKSTDFFKSASFEKAVSHIDDKYGIDVDELYEIEEILPSDHKEKFKLELTPREELAEDNIHLGYLRLSKLAAE